MKYLISLFLSISCFANLNIITTTSNLADVVKQIGGEHVDVLSLAKGAQDPHFLEAKPSYTFKLAKADLLVSVGADLEVGWLPLVIRGSRNPKLRVGGEGRIVAASSVVLLKEHTGPMSRAQGDVHPLGNPHFMLSPSNSIKVAKAISDRLQKLDDENAKIYNSNFNEFKMKMNKLILELRKSIQSKTPVITYHRTLSYFLDEFKVRTIEVLEPKPGIPPTASHIIHVMKLIKDHGVKNILVENYFDTSVAMRIKSSMPSVRVHTVPVSVNGDKNSGDIFKLYRQIAKTLE